MVAIWSAPRVCGDDPSTAAASTGISNVLPAYAGMIPAFADNVRNPERAPRVCGDDPAENTPPGFNALCSPRMRG